MEENTLATWPDLESELDGLRAALPRLRSENPSDTECHVAFDELTAQIRTRAAHDEEHAHHVSVALVDMLIELGLVPEEHRQH